MSKIIFFAGHYPKQPGACWEGLCEHDEAVRWCSLLEQHMGEEEFMWGPTGRLKDKTTFVNKRNPILTVDLHFNAWVDEEGKPRLPEGGCMTLYYPGSVKGELAAGYLNHELSQVFPPNLGVREGYYALDPKRGPDWFLERTKCTALILEPDYIHRGERIRENRAEGVDAIVRGLRAALIALA